jgi:hypothetical protein
MSPPKPPEAYTGEKDESTGVGVANDIPYAYTEPDEIPASKASVYRFVTYIDFDSQPARKHVYFVPAERLGSLLETWAESDEIVIEVEPTTWSDAEAEMAEYRGGG